ncbi:alpha-ketoglutarate-dependent dioxygenase AlkB [Flavobacterium sp. HNIBRBA15423]|uniref:alpha-ketoglutarate-dependent dioxygenase AlkB n=1 Tax=Flavobacterium sp. HNIBRBA15423 TaxID=3458683 RepID=UPI004044FB1B
MNGIIYIENFIADSSHLFELLKTNVIWDERMVARKTASFGKSYDYSQIHYPYQEFLPEISEIIDKVNNTLNFEPNNCLINYYLDGKSKMGFHSDQTDILFNGTGVAIVSLGETRILRFRNIENKEITKDYLLQSGSLFYMTSELQSEWQHAIPKSNTEHGRMSLTFRKMK